MIRALAAILALGALLAAAAPASAHDARPLSISATEQSPGVFRVVVLTPPTVAAPDTPRVVWPEDCALRGEPGAPAALLECPGGLSGRTLRIEWPNYNPSITSLVRVRTLDGVARTAVLPPDELSYTVPVRPTAWQVARDYLVLGFKHIWEGPDHLLFVAGLMLLARRPRRILTAVTGFTVAHSLTLSLAVLGLVRLPIPFVEAMIALSIVFLAAELVRANSDSFSRRHPVSLSFLFGLLHGFGFASALQEIGLPAGELAVGLVFFNLGVEAGQVAFIAAAGAAFLLLLYLSRPVQARWAQRLPAPAPVLAAYVLGVPAALWFFQRMAGALGA